MTPLPQLVDCAHLTAEGCAAGHYARPSRLTCLRVCKHRSPNGKPLTLAQVAHGAAGIAKAIVGIDRASDETIAARKATCATCPHNTGGLVVRCRLCGCALAAKLKLAGETCPAGKW